MFKKLKTIVALVLVSATLLTIVGCSAEKTPIDAEDLIEKAEDSGYVIQDAMDQFEGIEQIETATILIKANKEETEILYQIEFYEIDSASGAAAMFEENKERLEENNSGNHATTSVAMGNYAKYTLSGDDKYSVVSLIDDTVIYLSVDSEYKDDVKDFLKEIGY